MSYDAIDDAEQLAHELARLEPDDWPLYLALVLQRVHARGYRQAVEDRT